MEWHGWMEGERVCERGDGPAARVACAIAGLNGPTTTASDHFHRVNGVCLVVIITSLFVVVYINVFGLGALSRGQIWPHVFELQVYVPSATG